MKYVIRIATPLIAVVLMGGAPIFAHAQTQPTTSSDSQSWETPPAGSKLSQQAYHDGVQSALADKLANRKIDAKSSNRYVHPPVGKQANIEEYRTNFVSGYEAAVKHNSTTSNGSL